MNSRIPSTDVNDSCHPAWNSWVGLRSKRIIAANERVLIEFECLRKKIDAQKILGVFVTFVGIGMIAINKS